MEFMASKLQMTKADKPWLGISATSERHWGRSRGTKTLASGGADDLEWP